jgi:hypothetical protein
MGLPEPVTYLLLVVLGYALTRVVDLGSAWLRNRVSSPAPGHALATAASATARQRLIERHAVYSRFRKSVNDAVDAAVNHGHGTYGMLYQIRDDYGDLLRHATPGVSAAADSIIRCVTLLVNLGSSDQRFAMFTRALAHFDGECLKDDGVATASHGRQRQEFKVLDEPRDREAATGDPLDPQPGSESESAHLRM